MDALLEATAFQGCVIVRFDFVEFLLVACCGGNTGFDHCGQLFDDAGWVI